MTQAPEHNRLPGTFGWGTVREKEQQRIKDRRKASRPAYETPSRTCYVKSIDRALKTRDRLLDRHYRLVDEHNAPDEPIGLAALALSGGGVRSATFNLGVLQRLHELGILQKLDYLSTVSGGGYIGSSLIAYATAAPQETFPFPKRRRDQPGEGLVLRHLRQSSSYLVARGWLDAVVAGLALLGGMLANILILLPYLVILAVVALLQAAHLESANPIGVAVVASCVVLLTAFGYVLVEAGRGQRERSWDRRESVGRWWARLGAVALLLAALNIQPVLLHAAKDAVEHVTWQGLAATVSGGGLVAGILSAAGSLSASPILRRPLLAFSLVVVVLLLLWILFAGLGIAMLTAAENVDIWYVANLGMLASILLFALGRLLPMNCGSLHGFYRDRLSRAYFFKPHETGKSSLDPFDECQLSNIAFEVEHAPYLLMNACLNVSDTPRRREDLKDDYVRPGRRGTFFLFSREAVGNDSLGYVSASKFEEENGLKGGSLATAMAISGAAFGANMGYSTYAAAVFLLTLLNVRTARWVRYPDRRTFGPGLQRLMGDFAYLTLTREAISRFDSRSGTLLLSDGGHIDNLGLYQLFKRRCTLVIACDAEADPSYKFEGLAAAVRLAKIDLNVEVDIGYAQLAAISEGKRHFAVGEIRYPEGTVGSLIYLKSSLTDEVLRDVSLLNYHRSNADFPHETTADQFFSERQFEAYRSLGYAVCERVFEGPEQ